MAPPLVSPNGEVLYVYGENNPVVRCVPLHLWVVSLFKDEKIVNLSPGDSVHWLIESAQVRLACRDPQTDDSEACDPPCEHRRTAGVAAMPVPM